MNSNSVNSSTAKWAFSLIIISFFAVLFYIAQSLIIPMIMGIIFSILLFSPVKWLERKKFPRILAIITVMVGSLALVFSIGILFSNQFSHLLSNVDTWGNKILKMFEDINFLLIEKFQINDQEIVEMIKGSSEKIVSMGSSFIGNTLASGTSFLAYSGIVIVYIFLFLLYRDSFKAFILYHFKEDSKRKVSLTLKQIVRVIQNYFLGVLFSVLLVGTINSLGLWALGIEYAPLFGFFAALLSIIPYVGTTIGGLLPTLFALLNYDEYWKPIAVIILYQLVQTVEGNFITPKIVGSKVSINALVAIVALLVGASFWGIAGMVLSIPLVAVFKVVCDNVETLKPYGKFLSAEFASEAFEMKK